MKLVANDDYYDGRPYLDSVTYKIIPDANAAVAQLQAGILISLTFRQLIIRQLNRLIMSRL